MRTGAEKIANRFLAAFTMLLLSFLTIMAFLFSQRSGIEALGEIANNVPIYKVWDNVLFHLAGILSVVLLWVLCSRTERKIPESRLGMILFQAVLSIGSGVSAWLVLTGGTRSLRDDQLQIYGASMLFNQGNYINLIKGGYINMYPQQLGMIGYIRLILRLVGSEDFYPLQLLNCFWITGLVFALCLCLNELSERRTVRVLGSLMLAAQLPLVLLVSWVYGDLPSYCCCAFVCLAYLRLVKARHEQNVRILHGLALILCLCAAILFRKNCLILAIALAIGLVFHWLDGEKKSLRSGLQWLALAAACLLLPEICIYAVDSYYERVSGYEVDGGLPTVMWVAMGVSEDASTPGWFTNFSVSTYYSVDCDREAAAELARERISQRLELFREDPVYCISFYKRKICTQWNDPYYCTESLIRTDGESRGASAWLEKEQQGTVLTGLSVFQFLLYAGALLYTVLEAKKRRVCDNLFLIYFAGGFLFSLLWEASSRYVLPYVLFLIPYAAVGWDALIRRIFAGKDLNGKV